MKTLYEKLLDAHTVRRIDDDTVLLYVDFHVMNEYTSPQAFAGLHEAGRSVRDPGRHLAIVDHVSPTRAIASLDEVEDAGGRLQIETLAENCARHEIELIDLFDPRQGIEHVVVPDLGLAWPGTTILCGDSHTTTYGAFGALAYGIGTSEIEHILATQTVEHSVLKPMRITLTGAPGAGVTAKDMVMAVIARIGANGAAGHAVEWDGPAVAALGMEGRMTLCNMIVEAGARVAVIAPDGMALAHLGGRPHAPTGDAWDALAAHATTLRTDEGAVFAREVEIDVAAIAPLVTWGTSPDQAAPIFATVPDPRGDADRRALDYMDLVPGMPLHTIQIDRAFIGSCTNARIEDLRAAAQILRGRRVADGVTAICVPGSKAVRAQAEAEGLDAIFREAGFEWRGSGCSMCLAMNDDVAATGERLASSTNRNFEGRQGRGARTHLMSPAMVAAAAVTGHLTDVRKL
ncbi:3-isopropylmalate dehydratase large subunit [Jannaschia aquimarina]|uniref:3-isopropylmalate dehydratase n=1 Tax=Jannaschia aquimarina TaxID=935700 RepID=A0A0D1CNB8_9RHOB|nr:3-isopropylmalate dehydratase large subunit [Jannaschia aquimarina]KIT16242.1 3-isopropylmalate dehydratase large subunit [Jannaschia aquimarina]SNT15461.1 3-isopropylmalate dehydratase, large subunit [Jannaschia aquimarina]